MRTIFASFQIKYLNVLFAISIQFLANNSFAEDSIAELMQKMKSDTVVKMTYQEIRTLELMDQPWYGSGVMYAIAPDLMVREQLKPQRLLMGIKGNKLFYFDPDNHVRHQAEMEEDNPLSLNIAVFKALITGDEALLKRMYLIAFESKAKRWMMTLKSKNEPDSGFSIVVSGVTGQLADTIITQQADGDLSEFILQQQAVSKQVKNSVNLLYKELVGE